MKPRTCAVQMWISNDKGLEAVYMLRPLAADQLQGAVCGFRLTKTSDNPSPVYHVRLLPAGLVSCDCPQHNFAGGCKHADALLAASVLPAPLLALVEARTKRLDELEAEATRHSASVANLAASVSNLAERNALLVKQLDEAQDMIQRLEKPRRSRRPRVAPVAA